MMIETKWVNSLSKFDLMGVCNMMRLVLKN